MLALRALLALQLAAPQDPNAVATLVARARTARYQQDSALASYQAVARQRMSSSIGLSRGLVGSVARPRLAARFESVARVGWDHALGAWGEIIGARSVVPIVGGMDPDAEDEDVALVLPYYPGRDRLWPITELRDALPEVEDFIAHPLEKGADSLYAFAVGDSLSFRLPDATVITLREVRVRPRRPASRLIVGSLWVDVASGALVRAAYRPSQPIDMWPLFSEELDREDRDKIKALGPFLGIIREIVVEHGLYERRFWLPRTRIASAEGTAKMGRVTISIEQTFTYERVRALAPGVAYAHTEPPPDLDPRDGRVRRPKWRGVEDRTRRCRERGDSSARWDPDSLIRDDDLTVMYAEGVRFRVLLPCDRHDALVNSPALPRSIYSDAEELFTDTDFKALRNDAQGALALSSQAEWQPQKPSVHYGIERGMLRFNRVEGISAGASIEQVLGDGYTAGALARIGVADLQPNGELTIQRSNVRSELGAAAYRRLATANDWGDVLSLGSSARAAIFGQDGGFYYRALGAELTGAHRASVEGPALTWRLFGERHDSASVGTQQFLFKWLSATRFQPNVVATEGAYFGGSAAVAFAWGLDPEGTRLSGATRLEGAGGETSYGRAMLDVTIARGFGRGVVGTLTGAAGNSVGSLPPQRSWYLGGSHTVRGQRAGAAAGDAFWFGRLELARGHPLVRPTIFGDIGWAGSRRDWRTIGRPLSGAGVGAALLDGMVRLDVARGIGDAGRWRADFYFEIR